MVAADTYVPGLRWRQGEYQALLRLSEDAKRRIVPLITIPPIEFDFEESKPKNTPHDHVAKFPKRLFAKWKDKLAWVDIHESLHSKTMNDGTPILEFVYSGVREVGANVIPVVSLDVKSEVIKTIAAAVANGAKGIAIRARVEHVMLPDFSAKLMALIQFFKVDLDEVDFILDLGAPGGFEPYDQFAKALISSLSGLGDMRGFRSFVLLSSSFPDSFGSGSGIFMFPRHDWLFYKEFLGALPKSARQPSFGDYTVVHPMFVASMDMRMIKPAGKLIYTTGDNWSVWKGGSFRGNPSQMRDHCAKLVKSGEFRGASFSPGNEYIYLCAQDKVGYSTLTKWREISIDHHIMCVLGDIASLHAAS